TVVPHTDAEPTEPPTAPPQEPAELSGQGPAGRAAGAARPLLPLDGGPRRLERRGPPAADRHPTAGLRQAAGAGEPEPLARRRDQRDPVSQLLVHRHVGGARPSPGRRPLARPAGARVLPPRGPLIH